MKNTTKEKQEKKRLASKLWKENNREWRRHYQKEWRKRNKGIDKKYDLKRLYGLSLADFETLQKRQNYKCAICERKIELVVDHCHKTGKVRGLLCRSCNRVLGIFLDKPKLFLKASRYLKR